MLLKSLVIGKGFVARNKIHGSVLKIEMLPLRLLHNWHRS